MDNGNIGGIRGMTKEKEQDVRAILNREVLNDLDDAPRKIIKSIIYNDKNKIDWEDVFEVLFEYRSDLIRDYEWIFKMD